MELERRARRARADDGRRRPRAVEERRRAFAARPAVPPRVVADAGRVARAALRRVGLDVVRAGPGGSLEEWRLRVLARDGVDVVLDVGANTGQYGRLLRAEGYAGRIVSFEPLRDGFERLDARTRRDALWDCRRLALGDSDGSAQLVVAGNSLSSSLLPMTALHVERAPESRPVGRESVPLARLDSVVPDLLAPGSRPYLKLDVQGAELRVLRGAPATLARTVAVECELSLVPLYEGQPLLAEVVAALDGEGFDLVALEPVFTDRTTGKLLQLDGLFVKRP